MTSSTALAHPNIAFIKYWGNRDNELRLPVNGSISMNLDGLFTKTTVTFNSAKKDSLTINNSEIKGKGLERVSYILDIVRKMANINEKAEVTSENNFPAGAGIASSAAAFAALALSASKAAGLNLSESELSKLAR
ncbi:MAG: diphosphomevalonate decarboxylase, partial [Anaerolineales bacterium]